MCDRLQFILKIGQAHFWELRGGGGVMRRITIILRVAGGMFKPSPELLVTNSNIYELLQNLPNTCVWLISQFLKRPYLLAKKTLIFCKQEYR